MMPDIEKRLEAFVRSGHGFIVFPGAVGTTEEMMVLALRLMAYLSILAGLVVVFSIARHEVDGRLWELNMLKDHIRFQNSFDIFTQFQSVKCLMLPYNSIEKVQKIILIRPAVEAGEKLGFLPGDLSQKVDPYLRPLYDGIYEMLGVERATKLIEKEVIEVAPLAYLRGRTLNNAFIIMDESQNTTVEQMKMVLTRIGYGSQAVINGDLTQIDLPKHITSGLDHVIHVLKDTSGIGIVEFSSHDVIRHPLVRKIIDAYKKFESNINK